MVRSKVEEKKDEEQTERVRAATTTTTTTTTTQRRQTNKRSSIIAKTRKKTPTSAEGDLPITKTLTNPFRRKSTGSDDNNNSSDKLNMNLKTVPFESFHDSLLNRALEEATDGDVVNLCRRKRGKKSETNQGKRESVVSGETSPNKKDPNGREPKRDISTKRAIKKLENNDNNLYQTSGEIEKSEKTKKKKSSPNNVPTLNEASSSDQGISFLELLEMENQKRAEKSPSKMKAVREPSNKKQVATETTKKSNTTKKMPTSFLESLELENEHRKKKKSTEPKQSTSDDDDDLTARRRRLKTKTNSSELTETIHEKLEQCKAEKKKKSRQEEPLEGLALKGGYDYDADETPEIGWFSMSLKDSNYSASHLDGDTDQPKEEETKKSKTPKYMRTSVEYSYPNYQYTTRKAIQEPAYYLKTIAVKKRRLNISNLFLKQPLFSSPYLFESEALLTVLNSKEDKRWIKLWKRQYCEKSSDAFVFDDPEEKPGMEVLTIFFGANRIDRDPNIEEANDSFSVISSVESVHFESDGDEDFELYYNGKRRDKVEITTGNFSILRKEEETYEAISKGSYMSSLCLGCGVALISVQDAMEVACPNCGSITPLNGISLRRPFGIATGIKRAKCEHLLTPRSSLFANSS